MHVYPERFGRHPLFPKAAEFEIVPCDDRQGLGVKSYRSFRAGNLVAQFTGDILHERTQHSLQIDGQTHIDDLYFAGYFLHSCAPNVELDMRRRLVHALTDINVGDFLRMDYSQTEEVLFRQFPCSCGAPQCRGWITGSQEQPDASDPRYLQIMTPAMGLA